MQQGREWEILVAQLEALFSGPGFRVQSPENIRSRRGGNTVEVDVTVRGRVGTQDVLIAFECRDRDNHQGVDWIQQLATRKEDIGASELIAVSRDGFTRDALMEANAWGISLRTLERLDLDELAESLLAVELQLLRARYQASKLDYAKLRTRIRGIDCDSANWPRFTPELLQGILEKPEVPQFQDKFTRRLLSVWDLVHEADWASGFANGYFDGRRLHVAVLYPTTGIERPEGRLTYALDSGHWADLDGFSFIGEVWWQTEPVKLSQAMRYSKADKTLATVAEFDLAPHGVPQVLQVFMGA